MSDDYGAFNIKQLWQMIDAAKNDLDLTHKQIGAWQRAQQMLNQHATALRGFRDQLADKWPPESNAASAAYLSELDRLLEAVSATAHASSSNAVQIGHVTDVIEQTHKKLDGWHKDYVDNEAKLAHYNAQLDAIGSVVGAQRGSLIGGLARGASKVLTESPVADGQQEQLIRQAREAMTAASSAARDASANLQPPPDYIPPGVRGIIDRGKERSEGNSGGAHRPPMIERSSPESSESGTRPILEWPSRSNSPHDVGHQSPQAEIPSMGDDVPRGPSHNSGPILSDNPMPATPSHGPVLGGASTGAPISSGGSPTGVVRVVPSWTAGGPSQQKSLDSGWVQTGPTGAAGLGVSSNRINGVSSTSMKVSNPGRVSPSLVQKVNPVGGVIGKMEQGLVGQAPHAGQSGRGKKSERPRWDPDNPWLVDEGVAPVITPDPILEIDPGPGIIGRDR